MFGLHVVAVEIGVAQGDVVGAAFDDGGGGDEGQTRVVLQLFDGEHATVAHGGANLAQRKLDVVFQRAGVWHVGIDAFFEGELAVAAHVITLPVAGAGRAFAPVFFHVVATDAYAVGWRFIEAGEVAAEHDEVCAHGKSEGHMIVVHDTTVGAERNVHASFFEIFVAGFGDFDNGGRLAAADAFLFTGDADGAAADADLDEVCACFGEIAEAVGVNDVAGANFDGVAVVFADPVEGQFLPFGVAFGGVDDEHICTGFDEGWHAFCVVAAVDAGADHVALGVVVEEFEWIFFVGIVVLAEDQVHEILIFVDDRQLVELVIPDQIVGFRQGGVFVTDNELVKWGHEFFNLGIARGAGEAIVAAGDDAEEFAVWRTIFGDSHGAVAGFFAQGQHIGEGVGWAQVGIGNNKACFVVLNLAHHCSLAFDGLGAIDEGKTAFFCQRDGQGIVGNGLHDSRDQWDVQRDRWFFAFSEFDQWGFEADIGWRALFGSEAWDQKILAKSVGWFVINECHVLTPFKSYREAILINPDRGLEAGSRSSSCPGRR